MPSILTSEFLTVIGFERAADPSGGSLWFDFGNFKLTATECVNQHLAEVWSFFGIYRTPRTLAHIDFELPLTLDSTELGLAFMAFGMGRGIDAETMPDWYRQGLTLKHHLPWEKEQMAYRQQQAAFQ